MDLALEVLKSAVRHGSTVLGGFLAARGLSTQNETDVALAAAVAFFGWGWSVYRQWSRGRA